MIKLKFLLTAVPHALGQGIEDIAVCSIGIKPLLLRFAILPLASHVLN